LLELGEILSDTIRFVHISDTHLGSAPDFDLKGATTLPRATALIDRLNRLDAPVDFVIHTGDMATDADKTGEDDSSTQFAAKLFSSLRHPLLVFNGNHDSLEHLNRAFGEVPGTALDDRPFSRAKHWTTAGNRFLFLDARAEFELDPAGRISEAQIQSLDRVIEETDEPLTVFLHYPPTTLDSWFDDRLLIGNGNSLHDRFRKLGSRLKGVFFGHVHCSMQVVRDGVFYCAVGAASCQFRSWHGLEDEDRFDPSPIIFFNYITLDESGTTVKQCSICL